MVFPIVAFGDPVLKKKGVAVAADYPLLAELISNLFETMYAAHGVGLAAQQVGLALNLFIVDASPFAEDDALADSFKKVFLNMELLESSGEPWLFSEGCLSIPEIREDILRNEQITVRYDDENFNRYTETFGGIRARIILHEFDHTQGKLFTDYLSPLKKRLLQARLEEIRKGEIKPAYKMRFFSRKNLRKSSAK